jgi:hypothetical protein
MFNNPILAHCDAVTQKWEVPCIRLELTGVAVGASSQLGLQKHTQLFLNNQLLPAIQVGR